MFGFGKNKTPQPTAEESSDKPLGLMARLRAGLARTRANLSDALGDLLGGSRQIDDDLLEDIETLLLTADVGVDATRRIIADLTARVRRKELADPAAVAAEYRRLSFGRADLALLQRVGIVETREAPARTLARLVTRLGDLRPDASLVREFVDDFALNQGRIHVEADDAAIAPEDVVFLEGDVDIGGLGEAQKTGVQCRQVGDRAAQGQFDAFLLAIGVGIGAS